MPRVWTLFAGLTLLICGFAAGFFSHRNGAIQAMVNPLFKKDGATPSGYAVMRQALFEIYPRRADVVVIGDSIAEWLDWPSALPNVSIVSRAIGGETVSSTLNRLDTIQTTEAKTAIVMIGINDLGRWTPVDEIFTDYTRLIEALNAAGMRVVVYPCLNGMTEKLEFTRQLNERLRSKCVSRGGGVASVNL